MFESTTILRREGVGLAWHRLGIAVFRRLRAVLGVCGVFAGWPCWGSPK